MCSFDRKLPFSSGTLTREKAGSVRLHRSVMPKPRAGGHEVNPMDLLAETAPQMWKKKLPCDIIVTHIEYTLLK